MTKEEKQQADAVLRMLISVCISSGISPEDLAQSYVRIGRIEQYYGHFQQYVARLAPELVDTGGE